MFVCLCVRACVFVMTTLLTAFVKIEKVEDLKQIIHDSFILLLTIENTENEH